MVSESVIPGLEIRPPKASAGEHDTEPDQVRLPFGTAIVCGKSGAGKSLASCEFINMMEIDRVFWVGCTIKSNRALLDRLGKKLDPGDIFEECVPEVVDEIRARVEQEAQDLEEHEKQLRRYRVLMKTIHSPNAMFESSLLTDFYESGEFLPPVHKWGGRAPRLVCVIDDALGSELFSKPRKINALSTFSRHLGAFTDKRPAIGLNLMFLVQTLKAQIGGLSKVIRNQCKLYLMFKSHSRQELESLVEAVAGEVPKEVFKDVYKAAIRSPHDFLFIDLNYKRGIQPSMFRRGLNTYLIPEESGTETIDLL